MSDAALAEALGPLIDLLAERIAARVVALQGAPSAGRLTVKQAADYAGVSPTTVRVWLRQGLAAERLPGRTAQARSIRIRQTDLDSFLARTVTAVPVPPVFTFVDGGVRAEIADPPVPVSRDWLTKRNKKSRSAG